MIEAITVLFVVAIVLALVLAPVILALIAYTRSKQIIELTRRVNGLETLVRELMQARRESATTPAPAEPAARHEPVIVRPPPVATPARATVPHRAATAPAFDLESFIGRRALGWVAVVLIIFATAFFLRYAFENNWIGPVGRVTLAAIGGLALIAAGWHYNRRAGWRIFAQMLTSAGVVLLYLGTYSAFGFYHLLPQRAAGIFLFFIVVETMVLAVQYDALALGLMAVLGGLLTPVLMQSETDQYRAFFLYLAVLNVGVVLLAVRRPWPAVTTVGLAGTQVLFWSWYTANDHPEKLPAELAFQGVVFLLFLVQGVIAHWRRQLRMGWDWEDLARWVLNASLGFTAFYVLLKPDYNAWMGTLAVGFAALYVALARMMLAARPEEQRLFLTTVAVAVGFITVAIPIQADAEWVALCWAAEASALWWFGLRVRQPTLRALATALAVIATVRVVFVDALGQTHAPTLPIFNSTTLPAIGASACLLAAIGATARLRREVTPAENTLAAVAEIVGVLQLWLVLSVDIHGYCMATFTTGTPGDQRLAQMALSVLWAIYASAVLAAGFRFHQARLRWAALGLYGITVGKVFLYDMEGLNEVYRILAFLVLAILLGLAAAVYQRTRPEHETANSPEV